MPNKLPTKTGRMGRRRKGNILVFGAFLMVIMIGMCAFALDTGYIYVTRSQLQRCADAAAMAAAWEMIDTAALSGDGSTNVSTTQIRTKAQEYAAYNYVLADNPQLSTSDVTIGYIDDPFSSNWQMQTENLSLINAVTVRVRRHTEQNGEVPLFFAHFLGHDHVELQAQATAAVLVNIRGFGVPNGGGNQGILPYALDEQTWLDMLAGGGDDDWSWDEENEQVVAGSDNIREVNLFPQGTGSPGNRGTVDIGGANNSTADIARQIVDGVSPDDMAQIGGSLELDDTGELLLNGDTGISAGVKDELESIKGEPRVIPIFRSVIGNGNNAMYTIVGWVGIRILEVHLTGNMSGKRVIIQPANITMKGAIPGNDSNQTSQFIYSPVWLVK